MSSFNDYYSLLEIESKDEEIMLINSLRVTETLLVQLLGSYKQLTLI